MCADRLRAGSGSPYEPQIGFSRAFRVGNVVAVSGTAPVADDGSVFAPGDTVDVAATSMQLFRAVSGE